MHVSSGLDFPALSRSLFLLAPPSRAIGSVLDVGSIVYFSCCYCCFYDAVLSPVVFQKNKHYAELSVIRN